MAASRFVEEESGTYEGQIRHPHNGYFAGDFSRRAHYDADPWLDQRGQGVGTGTKGVIPTI